MTPRFTLNRRQLIAGSALLLPPFMASSQGTPVSSSDGAISSAIMLDHLPGKRVNAFFARHSFMPNGATPPFDRVGSALVLVESGTLTLASDGPVALRRFGETGPVSPMEVPPDELLLDPGDAALIPHGQRMSLGNHSNEQANVLMLIAYAPYREFSYVHPTALPNASGVTTNVIGFGTGAFTEVPAVMLLQRDVVRPGGSAYSTTYRGIEIGGIDSGSARATFGSGTNWVTRGAMENPKPPILHGETEIEEGSIVDLETSDGYVSRNGSITWRAIGDGQLVVVRAQLIPVPQPAR